MKTFIIEGSVNGKIVYPDQNIIPRSKLTESLDQTFVYDERDNPETKCKWWNAIFPQANGTFHAVGV